MASQTIPADYGQLQRGIFDPCLVEDCAKAFASATELGAIVSSVDGSVLAEYGHGCASCNICELAGLPKSLCLKTYISGMREAERFGGKYIYFCAMGLTCFSSPVVVKETNEAEITVGPFLMVDREDYETCDLIDKHKLPPIKRQRVMEALDAFPYIPPRKVNDLATLLFMSISFMNNIWAANDMLETQMSLAVQTQISSAIYKLKGMQGPTSYPFDVEEKLLEAVSKGERDAVENYLNELFGYIFFSSGHVFSMAKSRIAELLVLVSRTAVRNGADPEKCMMLTHDYLFTIPNIQTWENLCSWLIRSTNSFIDLFTPSEIKHANAIHQATLYIRQHYAEKISLDSIAKMVYLSPTYFSRVFKKETGATFNSFLNEVRIEKSKALLRNNDLKMVDIALMVGFESQSYFTKVFKKITGISPLQYRYSANIL